MQLAANAVVLVLDPSLLPHSPDDLCGIRDRGGEHEADGASEMQCGLPQPILARQRGRLSWFGDEHQGSPNVGDWAVERRRDRFLEQTLAQPDAQLPGRDLAQVARFGRRRAQQELGHQGRSSLASGGFAHGPKAAVDFGHCQAWHLRGTALEQLQRRITHIRVTQVCPA